MVWRLPTAKIADILGITESAVYKRCKSAGIDRPPRGYWHKKENITGVPPQ